MTVAISAETDERFASLHLLREAHAALLARERQEQGQPAFAAELRQFLRRAQATGALLDKRADRRAAQSLLDYWATALYEQNGGLRVAALAPFDERAAPLLPDSPAPYVGLDAFDEQTRDRFFGRQELITAMVRQLEATRMVAVVGSSGSGKSSIVRAGVLAELASAPPGAAPRWQLLPPIVPGSDPIESVIRSVYHVSAGAQLDPDGRPNARGRRIIASLSRALREGEASLGVILDTWLSRPAVLTVDQFEELFTLCRDQQVVAVFVANLVGLLQRPGSEHALILTMRSDFEDKVARLPELKPLFDAARVQVAALSITQLRDAIEEPARRVGLVFEDGIVDDLIAQSLGETAALPLLQFTLSKLWERRSRNRVTLAAYRQLGGMAQALSTSADRWYHSLIPEDQRTAKRILLELVRPTDLVVLATEAVFKGERRQVAQVLSEGLEVTRTRRRALDLFRTGEDPDRISRVLDRMIGERIVRLSRGDVPADDQIEVAHEALIRNWGTLQGWIEEDYERLRQRGRLIEAASQWEKSGRSPDLLWRGSPLAAAQRLNLLDDQIVTFLQASAAAEERQLTERQRAREQLIEARRREAEERQQAAEARATAAEALARTAEAERQRAEEQAQSARRLRVLSTVLALSTLVAVIATVFAVVAAQRANTQRAFAVEQRGIADGERMVAVAQRRTAERGATNEAEAKQTAIVGATNEARANQTAQLAVATANTLVDELSSERNALQAAEATIGALNVAQQTQIAELSIAQLEQQTVIAVEAANARAQRVSNFVLAAEALAPAQAVDPGALRAQLAEGIAIVDGGDRSPQVMDALQIVIRRASELPGINLVVRPGASITSATWNNDGSGVLLSSGLTASSWDATTGALLQTFDGHSGVINAAAWSSGGTRVATVSRDRTARIWDVASGESSLVLGPQPSEVTALAWSPDDQRIVTANASELIVWDSGSGTALVRIPADNELLTRAAWAPDGSRFISAGDQLRIHDGASGVTLTAAPGIARFRSAAWSPDGQLILTTDTSGRVQSWRASDLAPLSEFAGANGFTAMWSRTGSFIVVGGTDGILRIYDTKSGSLVNELQGQRSVIRAVAWSPDGQRIVAAGSDDTAHIIFFYPEAIIQRASQILRALEQQ